MDDVGREAPRSAAAAPPGLLPTAPVCGTASSSVPVSSRSSNTTRLPKATRAVMSPTMTSAAGSCTSVNVVGTSTSIGTLTDTAAGTKPNGSRQPASITAAASGDSAGSTQNGSVSHCAPHTSADAQRVNVGDAARARRREIAVEHDVERGQRRRGTAESLELPAPRDQQRRETEDAAGWLRAVSRLPPRAELRRPPAVQRPVRDDRGRPAAQHERPAPDDVHRDHALEIARRETRPAPTIRDRCPSGRRARPGCVFGARTRTSGPARGAARTRRGRPVAGSAPTRAQAEIVVRHRPHQRRFGGRRPGPAHAPREAPAARHARRRCRWTGPSARSPAARAPGRRRRRAAPSTARASPRRPGAALVGPRAGAASTIAVATVASERNHRRTAERTVLLLEIKGGGDTIGGHLAYDENTPRSAQTRGERQRSRRQRPGGRFGWRLKNSHA